MNRKLMWCAQHTDDLRFDYTSLSYSKNDCIKRFVESTTGITWKEYQQMGWKAVRVYLTIESVKK